VRLSASVAPGHGAWTLARARAVARTAALQAARLQKSPPESLPAGVPRYRTPTADSVFPW